MTRTLADLRDAYLRHHAVERGADADTLVAYRRDFRALGRFVSLDTPLDQVTLDLLRAWAESLLVERLSPQTRYGRLRLVASALAWAVEEGWLTKNPAARLRLPRVPKRVPELPDPAALARFLSGIAHSGRNRLRDRAMFSLLYASGLRAGELRSARVQDVDLVGRRIRVTGKRGKTRIVPFDEATRDRLAAYLDARPDGHDPRAPLVTTERGTAFLRVSSLYDCLQRHTVRLGITTRLWMHGFRHTALTRLYEGSRDLRLVQEVAGHDDPKTTAIYTHLSTEVVDRYDAAMRRLNTPALPPGAPVLDDPDAVR